MEINQEFKPFLISDRSSAILHMLDAIQLTDIELVDLSEGICDRLGVASFHNPKIAFEIHDEGSIVPPPDAESVKETLDGILEESRSHELLKFQIMPHEALSLLGMVQAAIVSLPIPESLETFGKQFISQFCEKYKSELPSICESLKRGWNEAYQMTREEFDELSEEKFDYAINQDTYVDDFE